MWFCCIFGSEKSQQMNTNTKPIMNAVRLSVSVLLLNFDAEVHLTKWSDCLASVFVPFFSTNECVLCEVHREIGLAHRKLQADQANQIYLWFVINFVEFNMPFGCVSIVWLNSRADFVTAWPGWDALLKRAVASHYFSIWPLMRTNYA